MKLRNTLNVFRKELKDTLRDRRTLMNAIVWPLLITPVFMAGIIGLAIFLAGRAQKDNPTVMVLGEEHAPELVRRLSRVKEIEVLPAQDDYVKQINAKRLRVAVQIPPKFEENLRGSSTEPQKVVIYHYEGEFRSRSAMRTVERAITAYSDEVVKQRLQDRQISEHLLKPFVFEKQNAAPPEKVSGNILGYVLPYFLILMCLTGAMYPAIDLTAGEKERGTMETILTSPVSRVDIVLGKFLLVLLISLSTAALAIFSFVITILVGGRFLENLTAKFVLAVSGKAAAAVFFLVLPVAILFAAGLLAIAVIARSYREAQTYIGQLLFLIILPAMASFLPGIELNTRLAMVPILNISLVAKEILAGQYPWPYIGIIFGSTCAYAAVAIYLAVRQFHREEVLFRT
jgi:sodium transport system permease protein